MLINKWQLNDFLISSFATDLQLNDEVPSLKWITKTHHDNGLREVSKFKSHATLEELFVGVLVQCNQELPFALFNPVNIHDREGKDED